MFCARPDLCASLRNVEHPLGDAMRDAIVRVVHKYIDAVRRNDPSDLPLHPEVIGEFPMNTYRGAQSFMNALEPFSRIVKNIALNLNLGPTSEHSRPQS